MELRDKAFQEGLDAVKNNDGVCPYRSGQRLVGFWCDGVVEAVKCEGDIPDAFFEENAGFTAKLTLGRCFYNLGVWPSDRGYESVSPVFSGWLAEKDNKEKP